MLNDQIATIVKEHFGDDAHVEFARSITAMTHEVKVRYKGETKLAIVQTGKRSVKWVQPRSAR